MNFYFEPKEKTKGNGKGMTMNEGKGMMMMSEGKGMMMTSKGKRMMMTQGGKGMTMMSGIGGSKSSKSSSKEKKNFKSKGKKNRGKGSSKLLKYSKTSKEGTFDIKNFRLKDIQCCLKPIHVVSVEITRREDILKCGSQFYEKV